MAELNAAATQTGEDRATALAVAMTKFMQTAAGEITQEVFTKIQESQSEAIAQSAAAMMTMVKTAGEEIRAEIGVQRTTTQQKNNSHMANA